ncbi:MAG TPA: site-2 protease family protein, partial [Pirellulales bacterium]
ALQWAVVDTGSFLTDPFRVIQRMFARKLPTEAVGGPVRIFSEASTYARRGTGDFLYFLAMLSANLAVINFLPIPVLDGGHMVFLLYELVRGKPASEKFTLVLTLAGLFFLLGLFFLVTLQDIMWQFFPS